MDPNSKTDNIAHNLSFQESEMDDFTFKIRGFQEVILSVRDLEMSSQFYQNITGWEEVWSGDTNSDQILFWGLPKNTRCQEVVLANPGVPTGYMRLIAFEEIDQRPIRSSSQTWDTGGIYDIDLRATNLEATFKELQGLGWSGYNDPQRYEFGEFDVKEVLMRGPDDVVLAIIERIQPPLEGFSFMKKLSHVFNSSQIVKNMEESKSFYTDVLGFKVYVEHCLTGSEHDQNLFGMPKNLYNTIERKICILHPEGINAGSVELIQLDGAVGNDFAPHAIPPNLGLLLLRFPIRNIEKFEQHLRQHHEVNRSNITLVDIAPYGRCKCLAIKSPDGALLEFLELVE